MKNRQTYLPLIVFSALALGIILGGKLNYSSPGSSISVNPYKSKLNRLIDFIEREYVDEVNTDSIVDLTVNGILEQLDPHSVYIGRNELEEVTQSMRGDFVGIGVNFYMYKDTVAVIKPVEGGPSEKAGIRSGDRILFAGKHQLYGRSLPTDSLYIRLKGEVGSQVELTVFRKGENKKLRFKIRRDVVPIKSVDVAFMVSDSLGYIKINRFAETTYTEFIRELKYLKEEGANAVIVDVRDNGGGYLEKAVQIADEFLKKGELIVFTRNKKGRMDQTKATAKGIFENGEVFILINENSASASEILAGAIQDNDRGIVIGRRSFGKGLVQREMPLGDGSAVRLTVARYYTPSGRSIQKPYNGSLNDYYKEFGKRFENGELYEKDSIKVADSLKFKTKAGRTVYGGGGIVPDVFIPLQGRHGDEALEVMMQSGVVGYFVFEQLDQYRKNFEDLPFEEFLEMMDQTDVYFDNFRAYISGSGLTFRMTSLKSLVKKYLKAEFARQLYSEQKYFEILLNDDPMIKAVLQYKGNY